MNCKRRRPLYDGAVMTGQVCSLDPGMRVNGRMHCEEWAYDGPPAIGISDIGHIKVSINGKGTRRGK